MRTRRLTRIAAETGPIPAAGGQLVVRACIKR